MKATDFDKYGIRNFTKREIENTGANLADVKVQLFLSLQRFRMFIDRRIILLPNGLTTGNHKSWEHPNGYAVDVAFREADGEIHVSNLFKTALECNFRGFGIYHNEMAYSLHLDIGNRYRFWSAFKKHRENKWNYRPLIIDPIDFFT